MATIRVEMPQMGESVVEGTLERWLVAKGEAVTKDQNLCEITTDKVDAEVPAPEAGVVVEILVSEGETVEVGAELLVIDTEAEASEAPARKQGEQAQAESTSESSSSGGAAGEAAPTAERKVASPLARRIAEDKGIDLDSVQGSGPGGRVMKSDLDRSAAAPPQEKPAAAAASKAPAPAAKSGGAAAPGTLGEFLSNLRVPTHRIREDDTVIPFSTIRKRVAEHMIVSKIVSPHVGTVAEVDLHKLVTMREKVKNAFKKEHGFSLTYLPFAVAATVRALKDFPRMNATVVGQNIVEHSGIHVGVAVETERGLLVPVIRNADRLSLVGIAETINDLALRARDREISADDLAGGTFTVSNPGRQGNLYGFAVINQPQVGILRTGEVRKRPVVVEGDGEDTIAIHPMMHLALSYDHRIIDGVTGNGFLYAAAKYLEAGDFEI